MNVQQRAPSVRAIRKLTSEWICPSCSLKRSRRLLSSTSKQSQEDESSFTIRRHMTVPKVAPYFPKADSRRSSSKSRHNIVFSLIQPTGIPHLGNYLGAIRRWKELEQGEILPDSASDAKTELYLGLADLHSLTGTQSSLELRKSVKETFAALLAMGLGTSEGHEADLFVQSQVSYHSELMWILSTITSTGTLSRMVQWKDKSGISQEITSEKANDYPKAARDSAERLKLGLFSYPVLQAADILLYHATHVPVGEDQAQHVELTRTLARAFNRTFKEDLFQQPTILISPAKRVMSLQDPTRKMSKSDPDVLSRILVTDGKEVIWNKMKQAKTDSISGISYDPVKRPAVSNLIDILKFVTRSELSGEEIAKEHENMRWYNFKMLIADEIIKELDGIGDRFNELMTKNDFLKMKMHEGRERARQRAGLTMRAVHEAVGLDYPDMASPK